MTYSFDQVIDRRNTYSLKWDVKDGELPMWVADMDFQAAPEILIEIKKRCEHGVFGYSIIPDEWYQAYMDWWKSQHNLVIKKEWLLFCHGIIPAISCIIRQVTAPGDNIVIQTPVYNNFFPSIIKNERKVLESPLIYSENGYQIDFEDLEVKLADGQTTMMLLCNPQNPGGRIWNKDEITRIGALCYKHNVMVVSDEIHCDLTDPGYEYTPYTSIDEKYIQNSISCISPTKSFNLAGLQSAAVLIPNESIYKKIERGFDTDEVAEANSFAITAAIAAFTKGKQWLKELNQYLYENKKSALEYIKTEIPQIKVVPSHATYLLWLDCTNITKDSMYLAEMIRKKTGLILSEGSIYGENGKQFLRMNIACSKVTLADGLKRLKEGIENI